MDSDWCTFCGKHVETSGLLYCSEICRQKDRIAGSTLSIKANPIKPITNTLAATATFTSNLKSNRYLSLSHGKASTTEAKPSTNEIPFTLKLHKKNNAILPIMPKGYPTIMKSGLKAPQRYSIVAY